LLTDSFSFSSSVGSGFPKSEIMNVCRVLQRKLHSNRGRLAIVDASPEEQI
jgi:hypothetical protein